MKSTLRGSLVIRLVRMPAGYSRPCCSGEGGVGRTCPGLAIGGNVSFCWLAAAGRARCCWRLAAAAGCCWQSTFIALDISQVCYQLYCT
jgi:hypothetical protein